MAFFYVDTDGSGATAPYDTWAKAGQSLVTVMAAMSAGDVCYVQGAAGLTSATSITLASSGTAGNPCKIIAVKDGTTNTGTSVVTSDLLAKGTDTLFPITVTSNNSLTFSGYYSFTGFSFQPQGVIDLGNGVLEATFVGCDFDGDHSLRVGGISGDAYLYNCDILVPRIQLDRADTRLKMYGGKVSTTNASYISNFTGGGADFYGVDFSGSTSVNFSQSGVTRNMNFTNCKIPTSFVSSPTITTIRAKAICIACSDNAASKGNTTSFSDYEEKGYYGTIDSETTIIRTGGADDGATGGFSYAMTANASATLEGSSANLKSPWLMAWVEGGASKTCTVYIANSTASTDYNEDEVWCEFYTPDSADTAQHDQTFDPALARLLDSSTAVTDDTGSTWGTGGNNHQKFSVTTTPGFEGFVYARVHLAKRQASPDTLYLDPKIGVA